METLFFLLWALGAAASFAGWLWLVVMAFSNGDTLWGIGGIFIGLIALIYGVMNFDEAKTPVLLSVAGVVLALLGAFGMAAAGGGT